MTGLFQKIKQEKLLAAFAFIIWLFLCLTTVSKTYSYFVRNDIPIGLDYIFFESFLIWGLVAMFVPFCIWLAKKNPIEGEKRFRNAGIHILMSLFLVLVHALFFESIMYLTHLFLINEEAYNVPFNWGTLESYFTTIIWVGLIISFSYWIVVGGYHLKKYYGEYKERQLRNSELEAELASIRLHVLKVQLHPHFLFNTLHNINSLIYEDSKIAQSILNLLKRFLQVSINRVEKQQVSLEDELEFTGTYLEIEKTRFQNRLTIQKNIEEDTLNVQVPSFLLQPLVENAVKHGISKKMQPGILKITSKKDNGQLILTVEDNGPGISGTINSNGVGLENTKQRLNQLYSDAKFELLTSPLGGLKVNIVIPLN